MGKESRTIEFSLEGQFLGFAIEEDYKLKLLRLATASGEYGIKLPKELRSCLYRTLVPGAWIRVTGYQKVNLLKGTRKLKAHQVVPIGQTAQIMPSVSLPFVSGLSRSNAIQAQAASQSFLQNYAGEGVPSSSLAPFDRAGTRTETQKRRSQDTILVCQKSDCCKRGANALMQALQTELTDRGLEGQVAIRGTGCMKQCKAGPALVMPDKSRYTRLCPNQVAALIDKHFPETKEIAS